MGLLGIKAFIAGGIAIALVAAFGMFVQSIKQGERDRINAELAKQRLALSAQADESLQAANARLYSARQALDAQKQEFENWKQSHVEMDSDSCIVAGDLADRLRAIGSD